MLENGKLEGLDLGRELHDRVCTTDPVTYSKT